MREEIWPLEAKLDPDASRIDAEDQTRLTSITKAMGLYGLGIPPEFGGPDVDIVTQTLIAIETAQHRAGLYSPCFGAFGGAGLAQLYEANEDQKERYLFPMLRGEKHGFFGLTEPSGGSDPARAIRTKAERPGKDGRRLGDQRLEDLHLRRGRGRLRHRLRAHRRQPRARRHHLLHRRRRHARASTSAAWSTPCVLATTAPSFSSRTPGCRTPMCWAR